MGNVRYTNVHNGKNNPTGMTCLIKPSWENKDRYCTPYPNYPSGGSRIFPEGAPTLMWRRRDTNLLNFPPNCMKLRKFWSLGGGACAGGAPLDPALHPHPSAPNTLIFTINIHNFDVELLKVVNFFQINNRSHKKLFIQLRNVNI